MSVDDVMEPQDDPPRRDRREPGGGVPDRPDDEGLAERTQQERVDAGVADYNRDSVPPATDTPTTADITDSAEYQEEEAEVDRQVDAGELGPGPEREDFPPTRYDRA